MVKKEKGKEGKGKQKFYGDSAIRVVGTDVYAQPYNGLGGRCPQASFGERKTRGGRGGGEQKKNDRYEIHRGFGARGFLCRDTFCSGAEPH